MMQKNSLSLRDFHESLRILPEREMYKIIKSLGPSELKALTEDWAFNARLDQLMPEWDWRVWLVLSGRGWGKTRTGAEAIKHMVEEQGVGRLALVGATAADTRDVMVQGESGLLSVFRDNDKRPKYEPSKRRVTFHNGAVATLYSAEEPDRLRGPQHEAAWCDELCAWKNIESFDMLMLGLRLGKNPRVIVTTTPKPLKIIKEMLTDPQVAVTRGSTFDNVDNLAPQFIEQIVKRYEGTRLGRQELYAEVLDDTPGALWKMDLIDEQRVKEAPDLIRIVVAIDPAVSSGEEASETGIVVAGVSKAGNFYVLADESIKGKPDEWARKAVVAYFQYRADRVVGEVNNGGEMVEHTIRTVDRQVSYKSVHASRGKAIRAEPISALYETRRVFHVGVFPELESQMTTWVHGDKSPDRLDALVWAISELLGAKAQVKVKPALDLGKSSSWRR